VELSERLPLDRTTYDKTIEVMRDAVNGATIDRSEKVGLFAVWRNLPHDEDVMLTAQSQR
jgi:hypothetical protein